MHKYEGMDYKQIGDVLKLRRVRHKIIVVSRLSDPARRVERSLFSKLCHAFPSKMTAGSRVGSKAGLASIPSIASNRKDARLIQDASTKRRKDTMFSKTITNCKTCRGRSLQSLVRPRCARKRCRPRPHRYLCRLRPRTRRLSNPYHVAALTPGRHQRSPLISIRNWRSAFAEEQAAPRHRMV